MTSHGLATGHEHFGSMLPLSSGKHWFPPEMLMITFETDYDPLGCDAE
jgi:hypothetical protein